MANSKVNVSQLSSPAIAAVLQQEAASVDARSITSSPCSSVISEQEGEPAPLSRQSPFSTFPMSLNQASPSSSFSSIAFPRPDFGGCCLPDSETSSRSSLDGSFHCRETTDERREKYSRARRRRKDSSDSSKSAESGEEEAASERGSVAGGSLDGEETAGGGAGAHASRKSSRNMDPPTPTHPVRPVDAPRGRLANIRRESSGLDLLGDEVAHERLVKAAAQVSSGFDEFRLDEGGSGGGGGREAEEAGPSSSSATPSSTWLASANRKRTASNASLSEPISILTNAFLPHSCSPSPTRMQGETHRNKQCYSPSTQQIVRPNMPYSPSPSPTQSPTRNRLLRSLSPIASRSSLKRRFGAEEGGGGMMGMGGGMDGGMIPTQKRSCGGLPFVRNSTSPLVTDRSFPYPPVVSSNSGGSGSGGGSTPSGAGSSGLGEMQPPAQPHPFHLPAPSSSSGGPSTQSFNPFIGPPLSRPRFLVDPECRRSSVDSYASDGEGGGSKAGEDPISEPGSVQMALDDSLPMDCEDSPAVDTPGSVQEGGGEGGEQPEHAQPTELPGTSGGLSLDDPPADPTPRFRSPLVSSASLPSQLSSGLAGGGERDADREANDRSGASSGFSSGLSSGSSTPRGDVTPRHDVFVEPLPSTSSGGFGLPATSSYSLPASFGLPSALSLTGGGDDAIDTPQDPMMVDRAAARNDQRDADSVRDLPDLPPEEPGELDPPAQ